MGQAASASRYEPTFRSTGSETPAPASSLNSVLVECRADSSQGPGHTLQNDHITNHQTKHTAAKSAPTALPETSTESPLQALLALAGDAGPVHHNLPLLHAGSTTCAKQTWASQQARVVAFVHLRLLRSAPARVFPHLVHSVRPWNSRTSSEKA
jgi:hypothetical protein